MKTRHDSIGAGVHGGWSFDWRRAARRTAADVLALAAFLAVLAMLWFFGGVR